MAVCVGMPECFKATRINLIVQKSGRLASTFVLLSVRSGPVVFIRIIMITFLLRFFYQRFYLTFAPWASADGCI